MGLKNKKQKTTQPTAKIRTKKDIAKEILQEARELAYARSRNLAKLEKLVVEYDAAQADSHKDQDAKIQGDE